MSRSTALTPCCSPHQEPGRRTRRRPRRSSSSGPPTCCRAPAWASCGSALSSATSRAANQSTGCVRGAGLRGRSGPVVTSRLRSTPAPTLWRSCRSLGRTQGTWRYTVFHLAQISGCCQGEDLTSVVKWCCDWDWPIIDFYSNHELTHG